MTSKPQKNPPAYYAVRWGITTKITQKVNSPEEACLQAFECVASNMKVKNLGTSVAVIRSNKKLSAILLAKEGWKKPKIKNKKINIDTSL